MVRGAEVNASADDNSPIIYIPAWIFIFLCPTIVGIRIWSRRRADGRLGADDYTILISLAFALATDVLSILACYYGYGKHTVTLTEYQRHEALKLFYLTQITYKTSINLTKLSVLLLYLRIFNGIKWFRRTCLVLLAFVASYCIAVVIATVFQCIPITAAFDKTITDKICINNGHFWFANVAISIATDVIIIVIPMPLVYSLQIPRVQKAALIFVFTLGVFVTITSCLRATTLNLQAKSRDPLYDIASTMWTTIEMSVAIVSACLPQIRPLIVKLFPKIMPTIECEGGIDLAAIRKGDAFSGTASTSENRSAGVGIQRTVGYKVDYSGHGKESVTRIVSSASR
ncbi:hypothetical protein GQX73_g8757 [Xylaria multiplex]|uniref:Rhodopsin domain-containing protein n=1 Tax=Xylaria multiplex TaxID=323545 RepID=A0A7C8N2C4_9PEZI|nr:hypothetical protein GQX73_g8757 [Xylaria multiplex]